MLAAVSESPTILPSSQAPRRAAAPHQKKNIYTIQILGKREIDVDSSPRRAVRARRRHTMHARLMRGVPRDGDTLPHPVLGLQKMVLIKVLSPTYDSERPCGSNPQVTAPQRPPPRSPPGLAHCWNTGTAWHTPQLRFWAVPIDTRVLLCSTLGLWLLLVLRPHLHRDVWRCWAAMLSREQSREQQLFVEPAHQFRLLLWCRPH